jgi:glycosyltransferase involved in cell wall biosynthesis
LRILYLALSYIPSRRASSVQVMKMCAALARRGNEVVLVAKRGTPLDGTSDDHAFYCVDPSFEIVKVRRPAVRGGGALYVAAMGREILRRRGWADILYCRDPIGALVASELGLPVVFEAHGVPSSSWLKAVVRRVGNNARSRGMVAITDALRRDLIAAGIASKIVVAPDACDPPRASVRTTMSSPPRIGYVGNLYAGRGIETIVTLAAAMPHCHFIVVGGQPADVARWQTRDLPNNVELVGFRPQAELPSFYAGFDIVLMPHAASHVLGATGRSDISRWTSPMKMFEYMASGVPIVASDLPVIREVLRDESNALLVAPDDLVAWREAIQTLLSDRELRIRLASTAQQELRERYTWDVRAETVLAALGQL